jgi:hypothetical protein
VWRFILACCVATFIFILFVLYNCQLVACYRLVAEKLNKDERKGLAEVINVLQTEENKDFWDAIGDVLADGKYVVGSGLCCAKLCHWLLSSVTLVNCVLTLNCRILCLTTGCQHGLSCTRLD